MSGIDEIIIGACLQEKQPASLPWIAEKTETVSVVRVVDIQARKAMEVGKTSCVQHYGRRDDELISKNRDDESNFQEARITDDRFIVSTDGVSGKELTDFEITGRLTLQKKAMGVSCRYQPMEKVESAHDSYTKSMYNPAERFINDSDGKEKKEHAAKELFEDTDVLEQRHVPLFGKDETFMAYYPLVSPHSGNANTSGRAYWKGDKRTAQPRATDIPDKDRYSPEKRNLGKSVKCTQKVTRSMVEESRTGITNEPVTFNKPDIIKDETAKGFDISFDNENQLKEFTAITEGHVKDLMKGNMKRVSEGEVNGIAKQELDRTSKGEMMASNKSTSFKNYSKQTAQQNSVESSKKARNETAVDIDAQLNQLLNITADVCPSGQSVNEIGIGPNDIEFDMARKPSQYFVGESDVEWIDDRVFTPVTTTDDESYRGLARRDKDSERGRSRKRDTRKHRSRRQSSEDQASAESQCETRETQQRKNNNTGEDIDEIIKFTTEMMGIKQPKLTGKGRGLKSKLQCGEKRGNGSGNNEKCRTITEEEIEELNRKSEAVFQKRVRELRKPKKKSNVIRIDRESAQRRKRRQKLLPEGKPVDAQDKLRVSPVISADDDVYDISPVKNRETVFDTDTDESDKLCLSPEIKHDTLDIKETEPSIGVSKVRQVKSVMGKDNNRHDNKDFNQIRPKSNFHRKMERGTMENKRKTRKRKRGKDRVEGDISNTVRPCDDQRPSTSGIDIITKRETNAKPEQEEKYLDRIQTDDVVEISLTNETEENRSEMPPRRSTPYPRREEVHADLVDLMYESDVDSDYSSGSDLPDENPPVVQSRDFDFPLPVADRLINVYSSEDDYDEEDYDEEDVYDDDTEYSEEENTKKKGKLKRFFEWLFCCTKPRTED